MLKRARSRLGGYPDEPRLALGKDMRRAAKRVGNQLRESWHGNADCDGPHW
jgi:hypothetical protein